MFVPLDLYLFKHCLISGYFSSLCIFSLFILLFPTSLLYFRFNFRHRVPPFPFFTPLFLSLYHPRRRCLQLLPPFLLNPCTPSHTYPLPILRPRTCPIFVCKKITTSIMAYYRIAPLCCCLVSCFQPPLHPHSP
jgi:hypothetical protein